ncbi:putative uncharacterized protein [Parachlamydia acanthamoebae UV-7]|jgi:hypothetical protein|uniref:Uncharacterized protein n=2 Tax=Parachlamydia acanthamoebae TaxID=83552 RepID=F8KZ54_PARAV|nr:hypothetical protein [Parachlamydia acanthamoebae]EFB41944.1 hypothetical protein pah_c022o274 [Parachlamydia acanthamoebae str. Hall's coccus]KIA78109.1 hypothetical protein DB43_EW00190 [Parachlamydia acanthamoebae]CCB86177.1 putative uncharacterized protein [Parachlamydia acanthamoebae UV-7]
MTKHPPDKLFYQKLEVHIHPSKTNSSSFVSKLFSKLKRKIFSEPNQNPLQGRIQELHWNSTQIREELEKIKAGVDLDLQPLVFEVIDPMLRSIQQLHHITQNASLPAVHEKTVQRYMKWIEQAKLWVQLYTKAKDKEEVLKAVIDHIVLASNQIIERDLQILNEYKIQAIEFLDGNPEKKEALRKNLYDQMAPFLDNLDQLKRINCPEFQDLKAVSSWKAKIDSLRQENFNNALHAIDTFIEDHR